MSTYFKVRTTAGMDEMFEADYYSPEDLDLTVVTFYKGWEEEEENVVARFHSSHVVSIIHSDKPFKIVRT